MKGIAHNTKEKSSSVSVSADSGGNTASGGQVIEGETTGHVFIETTVNGEVEELIDEEVTEGSFERTSTYENENVQTRTAVSIEVTDEGVEASSTGQILKDVPLVGHRMSDLVRVKGEKSAVSPYISCINILIQTLL